MDYTIPVCPTAKIISEILEHTDDRKITFLWPNRSPPAVAVIFAAALWQWPIQDRNDCALNHTGMRHCHRHRRQLRRFELRIGPDGWISPELFLATKDRKRTYHEARDQFHASRPFAHRPRQICCNCTISSIPMNGTLQWGSGGVLRIHAIEAREQGLTALHRRHWSRYWP